MGKLAAFAIGTDTSNRRVAFHQLVEERFDKYVKDHGEEPEALILFMGGPVSVPESCTAWTMFGRAYEMPGATLCKAVLYLQRDAINPE